jgi:hypothetical protein
MKFASAADRHRAEIPDIAPAVDRGIAVEYFAPQPAWSPHVTTRPRGPLNSQYVSST